MNSYNVALYVEFFEDLYFVESMSEMIFKVVDQVKYIVE